MKLNRFTIIFICFCLFFSCNKKDSQDNSNNTPKQDTTNNNQNNNTNKVIEDLLVKNNEIAGWSYSGSGWTANNNTELTDRIDGGAELYIRYGFIEAARQVYQGKVNGDQVELTITIYNQGTKDNSLKVYSDPEIGLIGAIDWQNGAGEAAKYSRYNGLSQAMIFYRSKYFVYLEITADTDESLAILKQFAKNVDNKILK